MNHLACWSKNNIFCVNASLFFFSHPLHLPFSMLYKILPLTLAHASMHTHTHKHLYAHLRVHIYTYIHTHPCIHINMHIHRHIYVTILLHFFNLSLSSLSPQGSYRWTNWDVFLYLRMLGRSASYGAAWWACKCLSSVSDVRSLVAALCEDWYTHPEKSGESLRIPKVPSKQKDFITSSTYISNYTYSSPFRADKIIIYSSFFNFKMEEAFEKAQQSTAAALSISDAGDSLLTFHLMTDSSFLFDVILH